MIQILNPSHYHGQLSDPASLGQSPLFRGKIAAGPDQAVVYAYIKPMNDHILCPTTRAKVDNRAPAAEVIGYVLARAMGLSVPETAGVILLNADQIPPPVLVRMGAQPAAEPQPDYLCWFSQDMAHPSLKQYVWDESLPDAMRNRRLANLAAALLKHPETPRIVAFDDWLANSDRNLGNLLNAHDAPMLIDHERLFVYPNWSPGQLGTQVEAWSNKLFTLLDKANYSAANGLPMQSARAMAYNAFAVAMPEAGVPALTSGLTSLFQEPDIAAIMELVTRRLNPDTYARHIGLLA